MALASVILVASGTAWLIAEPTSSGAPAAAPGTQSPVPAAPSSAAGSSAGATADPSPRTAAPIPTPAIVQAAGTGERTDEIELTTPLEAAEPFETVAISGVYRGGADTFVEVQHWTDGSWQSFPVPAKTDASGQFTAYVELGRPSRYQLRVLDPEAGISSEPVTLLIKG